MGAFKKWIFRLLLLVCTAAVMAWTVQHPKAVQEEETKPTPPPVVQEVAVLPALHFTCLGAEESITIIVADADDNTVAGKTFAFTLTAPDGTQSTAEDTEQTGIIEVGDLQAGSYTVQMQPVAGYTISQTMQTVEVLPPVTYTVVDLSEKEITAASENAAEDALSSGRAADSSTSSTSAETPKIEQPKKQEAVEETVAVGTLESGEMGIDVSEWQYDIDWNAVKADGITYAIIRAGGRYYGGGGLYYDDYFAQNIAGAKAAGIKVGVYFFSQAINETEAVEEASLCIQQIGAYSLELPIFIDTEHVGDDARADKLTAEQRTKVCNAFCRTVNSAGYASGVYASYNWYKSDLQRENLVADWIWMASYTGGEPTDYDTRYDLWQYTSSGTVSGISGCVDMNIVPEPVHWSDQTAYEKLAEEQKKLAEEQREIEEEQKKPEEEQQEKTEEEQQELEEEGSEHEEEQKTPEETPQSEQEAPQETPSAEETA